MKINFDGAIKSARDLLRSGHPDEALEQLRVAAQPSDPIALQSQYSRLAQTIADALPGLPVLRVGFLAGSTIDHWVDNLRFWLLLEGLRLDAYLAPFNTWRQEAIDPHSGLYASNPDIVWFFLTVRDLRLATITAADTADIDLAVSAAVSDVSAVLQQVASRLPALIIANNAEAAKVRTFGNFEGTAPWSQANLIRRYNLALPQAMPPGSAVFDLDHQASCFGLDRWEDARLWCHSKHPFSLDAIGCVAHAGARLLSAARGRARKCLVLDLDNTLWGGVVGDDGVNGIRIGSNHGAVGEAFSAFQSYLKELSGRGVALAVCSKNEMDLAVEPFRVHPEMVLRLDDFVVFRANWDNKADNLRSIAAEMNIGLDALVFVDDNPAERALVRAELPEIAVPEMPPDPADYVRILASGAWFETLGFTDEDRQRTRSYRENAVRNATKAQATDLDAYLRNLEMHATWGAADTTRLPRIAQLVNKTNQFNLTTTRYPEAELAALASDQNAWVGWFALRDRFGDHGLIAVVILRFSGEVALIDTWTMSCRVFSRGMEDFTFAVFWKVAKKHGSRWLEGRYLPTVKNAVVEDLYNRLGGTPMENPGQEKRWRFDLAAQPPPGSPLIADEHSDDASFNPIAERKDFQHE
jgi:FkbH-like protein